MLFGWRLTLKTMRIHAFLPILVDTHWAVFIAVCIASISNARACSEIVILCSPCISSDPNTSANFSTSMAPGNRFMPTCYIRNLRPEVQC